MRQRTRTGCIGCRLRRKKCPGEKPFCTGCVRNGILCIWPQDGNQEQVRLLRRSDPSCQQRDHIESLRKAKETGDSPAKYGTVDTLRSSPACPTLRSTHSRRLLHHFVSSTSKCLALGLDGEKTFLAEMIPLAMDSELVLNGILACSGTHLSELSGTHIDSHTLMYYGQALQGQKFTLTRLARGDDKNLVPALVTAVILCVMETIRDQCDGSAIHHLKAAQFLLRRACRLAEPVLSSKAMLLLAERCAYTATLAHISLDSPAEQWANSVTESVYPIIQDLSATTILAGSHSIHKLFELIPQIDLLARKKRQISTQDPTLLMLESEYMTLNNAISSWKSPSEHVGLERYGKIYQQALLVYLASIFGDATSDQIRDDPYPAGVQTIFATFIRLLTPIPVGEMCTTALCWPLVIFGSCSRVEQHQVFVRDALLYLHKTYGSSSVKQSLNLLETMWANHDRFRGDPLGLMDVMRATGSLVLFW